MLVNPYYIFTVPLKPDCYSTFQVGCLREIGSKGEIGIRSIDAKITHPIVNIRIMVNVIFKVSTIALFLSNNHPEN